jgi:hypothetical protein
VSEQAEVITHTLQMRNEMQFSTQNNVESGKTIFHIPAIVTIGKIGT